ncbi:MAG: hypothetical protein U0166_25305 [Acidobacteriota bacterium]
MTRLEHRTTGSLVDLLVAERRFEREGMQLARRRRIAGRLVHVLPPDHLAAMKVEAAGDPRRDYDWGDARRLFLSGGARESTVRALVSRDLAERTDTLDSILRSVTRAREEASHPRHPRSRPR